MKTSFIWMSLGLFGAAISASGAIGYWAWDSLRGDLDQAPVTTTAQSQPTVVSPITPSPASSVSLASNLANAAQPAQTLQAAPTQTAPQAAAQAVTQTGQSLENDYLFDLSQALQPIEYNRLSAAEKIEIARQIQSWVESGADFWSLRQRFDASYGTSLAGNYAHNRDVYIRFATERFAPAHLATLIQPPVPTQANWQAAPSSEMPYEAMPYPDGYVPYPDPYMTPYPDAPYGYGGGGYGDGYGDSYGDSYGVPYSENPGNPYGNPYADPYSNPYSNPYSGPNSPQQPYGNPYPQQTPNQPNPNSQPNQHPSQIPNVTEVST
jgi:hypothetical protein